MSGISNEMVIAAVALFFAIAIGWMVANGYRHSSDRPGKKSRST